MRLFELLPGAGFGLGQRLLPLLFLTGFDLLRLRRHLLRLALRDGRVLQLDLVGEIVERRLRGGDAGLGLRDLGLVVGGIDLHQQIAGLDALKIGDGDLENLTRDAAAQARRVSLDIGVVGGLDHGGADPFIPAQRRQRDERRAPPAPRAAEWRDGPAYRRSGRRRSWRNGGGWSRRRGRCRSGLSR